MLIHHILEKIQSILPVLKLELRVPRDHTTM